jgi:hypothetical protein
MNLASVLLSVFWLSGGLSVAQDTLLVAPVPAVEQAGLPSDWRGEVRTFRDGQVLGLESLDGSLLFRTGNAGLMYQMAGVSKDRQLRGGLTHLSATMVSNSEYGHARNFGAVFPSNGRTGLFSVGGFIGYGGVTLNIAPEIVLSENKPFQMYPTNYPDWLWDLLYKNKLNLIDQPERYRTYAYVQLLPGNSSLSYSYRDMELSVTTRSLWWGPGKRNSLLMSTNAPGFAHLSLNSARPVSLPWGKVEFQLFWGRLVSSGQEPLPPRLFQNLQPMPYVPKPDDWRLLQGLMFSWQPEWSPGLYVGMGRTVMSYSASVKRVDQAFSVFRSLRTDLLRPEEILDPDVRERFDDKISAFARYVMPKEQVEFYAEVARNMRPGSFREFMARPEHTLAYTLGLSKWYELGRAGQFIGVDVEFTQMEKQNTWQERYYQTWYTSSVVPHGYTNRGQIMGASIGPGSNSQYLGVHYRWGNNRVGVYGERVIYNNDLYYILFTTSIYRHWADANVGVSGEYQVRGVELFFDVTMMRTFNYKYIETTTRPGFKYEGLDVWNTHIGVGVRYAIPGIVR